MFARVRERLNASFVLFVALTAFGVIANLLIAIHATQVPTRNRPPAPFSEMTEDASAWPVETPIANIWPEVDSVHREQWTTASRITAWGRQDVKTPAMHQMQIDQYGWPLPVIQSVQFWWPWEDPKYATSGPDETGMLVLWMNLFTVPASLATVVTSMVVGIPWLIRRRRARSGRCVHCGYALRSPSIKCPECGADRRSVLDGLPLVEVKTPAYSALRSETAAAIRTNTEPRG